MTTPHPHAEFFRAIADGEPLENWECRVTLPSCKWKEPECKLNGIFSDPKCYEVRRKPTPKVIDWSKLGRHVPVKFWDAEKSKRRSFLSTHNPDAEVCPFRDTTGIGWRSASLDTGLWVANHDGVNPWPAGVVVEVKFTDGSIISGLASTASWDVGGCDYIIMSRFHSLEDGYSFGGES